MARRTREHRGPGRGHDGTVDTPAAESEPPEDRDIHRAKSPTPAPETFTRAESTPLLRPLLTQPQLLQRLRRACLMIPQTLTHPSKLQHGDLRIPVPQMRRIQPTCPAPIHTTNLKPRRTQPPDMGEAVEGVAEHELECSCHFPIIFFKPPQKFQITSTRFHDVPYSLTFSCQLHTSQTSHILYIFMFLSPV